ncbi:hypothetical protein [Hymenobacter cellulosivorans]|uniref:PH domain-containing protein n=1 Tax=Hymenobacter cellulosivorans TaxID=2932249 RepID=A0ABY4FEE4_9BACT|nr:hypothetical protein [Hymenobacter cellulosivorans]UOQ55059.1 hypothetical protein MUN80_09940 [Hymenobacter cellulosivorans]
MDVTWGWQHVNFYPDERREQDPITEAEALAAYTDFPWQAQLDQLNERYRAGTTSVPPGVWFRRGSETLTLTRANEWAVLADYQLVQAAYFYELSESWWAHTLAPEDLIQMFFAGSLSQWPGWHNADPDPYLDRATAAAPELVRFVSVSRASWRVWWPLLGAGVVGVLVLLFTSLPWWAPSMGGLWALLLLGPEAWLKWQYARVSEGQQVSINPVEHRLRVQDRWGVLEFDREQVRECSVVRGVADRYSTREYAHIVFQLKNRQVCVITHETGPPEEIARLLGVHYQSVAGFPSIQHRHLSEQELAAAAADHQRRIVEFRERFSGYSSAQLEAIVHGPERYASHAVAAAEQLLLSRTITNR